MTTAVQLDVSASGSPQYRPYSGARNTVWTSLTTVYEFLNDAIDGMGYKKSTDQGATWGPLVKLAFGEIEYDIYYEQWTDTGFSQYVHFIAQHDSGTRGFYYNRLDLSSDTILNGSTGTLIESILVSPNNTPMTIFVSRSGAVHLVGQSGPFGVAFHLISTDHGVTWNSFGTFGQTIYDAAIGMPDGQSADPADVCVIWWQNSTHTYRLSNWDDSAGTWSTAQFAAGVIPIGAFPAVYRNIAAAYSRTTGHIAFVGYTTTASPNTLHAYDIYGSTVTAKTDVLTAVANAEVCAIAYTITGNIRAAYVRNNDVYWKESTDVMATWGAEIAYSTAPSMSFVRIDLEPSPSQPIFAPVYWSNLAGTVPPTYTSAVWIEVPVIILGPLVVPERMNVVLNTTQLVVVPERMNVAVPVHPQAFKCALQELNVVTKTRLMRITT